MYYAFILQFADFKVKRDADVITGVCCSVNEVVTILVCYAVLIVSNILGQPVIPIARVLGLFDP